MAKDFRKGYLSSQFEGGNNHTADPERYDIPSCLQGRGGKVLFEIFRFVWPSECTERLKSRAEPGIQDILVSLESHFFARRFLLCLFPSLALCSATHPVLVISINSYAGPCNGC